MLAQPLSKQTENRSQAGSSMESVRQTVCARAAGAASSSAARQDATSPMRKAIRVRTRAIGLT